MSEKNAFNSIDNEEFNKLTHEERVVLRDNAFSVIDNLLHHCREEKSFPDTTQGQARGLGFNACLTMIREATDIDWDKVNWVDGHRMTLWYSRTIEDSTDN